MDQEMKDELVKYGRKIREAGWRSGEPLIEEAEKRWPDFRRWANALAIMLRAEELLRQSS